VVEKDELISWLGDYITEESNTLFAAEGQNSLSLSKYSISTNSVKQFKEKECDLPASDKTEDADEVLTESSLTPDLETTPTEIINPIDIIEIKENDHAQSDLKIIENEYKVNNPIFTVHPNNAISLEEVVSAENSISQDFFVPEMLPIIVESLPIILLEQQPKSEFY
jgi:hypothetical protein